MCKTKDLLRIIVFFFCIFVTMEMSLADEKRTSWNIHKTAHFKVFFKSIDDLRVFNSKVICRKNVVKGNTISDVVKNKLDLIFEEVEKILGMHNPRFGKTSFKIFSDKKSLDRECLRKRPKQEPMIAWYEPGEDSVYCQVGDVSVGMVAHEIAHSIVDKYLMVPPPRETAEILARYVDREITKGI
ncbi:hypothetical protein HN784_01825 [bacterium]|nr:hypothetical protein [bacterium]MBT4251248.1 hypothetical protein [bacterium]MBT4598371.1 hypothetical protein [bacterium]MBT6754204.1 hypothetical protein [bacterium]MBT7038025.1 hypothetical protein [bacterium]